MTERTEFTGLIDPVAFAAALILAPVVVAVCGFWILFIPVVAVPYGAPFYVTAGALAFALCIMQGGNNPLDFALAGFLAVLVSIPLAAVSGLEAVFHDLDFGVFLSLGLIHGTAWGYVFGRFYLRFRNPFFVSKP